QQNGRRFLLRFSPEIILRGLILRVLLFGIAPLLLFRLDRLLEVIAEGSAIRRIVGCEEGIAEKCLAGLAVFSGQNVVLGLAHWKQDRLLCQCLRLQLAQRGVIVEDVDTAAKRTDDEVILLPLDGQVLDADRRQTVLEAMPFLAAVDREIERELGPGKE